MTKSEKYLKNLNNKFTDVEALGEIVVGSGNYSYHDKRYIVTEGILQDYSDDQNKELQDRIKLLEKEYKILRSHYDNLIKSLDDLPHDSNCPEAMFGLKCECYLKTLNPKRNERT